MSDMFLTNPAVPGANPPMPKSPGSLYLIGLLTKQEALDVARDALIAIAAVADLEETRYIKIQLGQIQSDYVKIDAMINAYLASSTIFRPISETGLAAIRSMVEQLQKVVAVRNKAADIIELVTRLLNEWDTKPAPSGAAPAAAPPGVPGAAPGP